MADFILFFCDFNIFVIGFMLIKKLIIQRVMRENDGWKPVFKGFKEPVYEAPVVEDYFAQQAGGDEMDIDLTDEDRTYLRLKWGKAYKPEEWVKLE